MGNANRNTHLRYNAAIQMKTPKSHTNACIHTRSHIWMLNSEWPNKYYVKVMKWNETTTEIVCMQFSMHGRSKCRHYHLESLFCWALSLSYAFNCLQTLLEMVHVILELLSIYCNALQITEHCPQSMWKSIGANSTQCRMRTSYHIGFNEWSPNKCGINSV